MQEPRILFFLACWKRLQIAELCFMGLERLMKRYSAISMAVISDPEMIPLCKKYGIDFVMHENEPLGRKKNAGLNAAMKKDFDYLIELGDDDLILDDCIERYLPLMRSGEDFFSSNQILFVDSTTGHCRNHRSDDGVVWGLGRCLSRNVLEAIGGNVKVKAIEGIILNDDVVPEGSTSFIKSEIAESLQTLGRVKILPSDKTYYLWNDDAMRALDNNSTARIASKGFKHKLVETPEPVVADLKGMLNLWGYNPEIGEDYDLGTFVNKLSQKEKSFFFSMLKKKKIETAA